MNNQTVAPKQLKKNDFLDKVTELPMARAELIDALDEFSFIPTYVDFLIDHFVAQGKIQKNEDGSIQRKTKANSASKDAFLVVVDGDTGTPVLHTMKTTGVLLEGEKALGWALTINAAIKKASSNVFAKYKEDTAAIKALADVEEEDIVFVDRFASEKAVDPIETALHTEIGADEDLDSSETEES
jgi:hypothetical protein